eukprot:2369949-Prymnesium_polylepis.2
MATVRCELRLVSCVTCVAAGRRRARWRNAQSQSASRGVLSVGTVACDGARQSGHTRAMDLGWMKTTVKRDPCVWSVHCGALPLRAGVETRALRPAWTGGRR